LFSAKYTKNSIFYNMASVIRDLSLEMPADEKARSGLMLAGGIISSKLEAFCVRHLFPPLEKERSLLTVDAIS